MQWNALFDLDINKTGQCFEEGSFEELHVGNDFRYLHTMLDYQ